MNTLIYNGVHGSVVNNLRNFLLCLEEYAKRNFVDVTINRMYLFDKEYRLNISVKNRMYLLTIDNDTYVVSRLNKQNSKTERYPFKLVNVTDGTFLKHFLEK